MNESEQIIQIALLLNKTIDMIIATMNNVYLLMLAGVVVALYCSILNKRIEWLEKRGKV